MEHGHYFKDVRGLNTIDVYKVCELFGIDDPSGAIQHAIKKLLVAGGRGVKDREKDIKEAIDTLVRYTKSKDQWLGTLPPAAPPPIAITPQLTAPRAAVEKLVENLRLLVGETATCCGTIADKKNIDKLVDNMSYEVAKIQPVYTKGDRTYLINMNGINHIDDYTKARKINDRTFVVTESLARELGVID